MRIRFALIGVISLIALVLVAYLSGGGALPPVTPETPGQEASERRVPVPSPDHEDLPNATISGRVLSWGREPAIDSTVRAVQGGRTLAKVTTGPEGWFLVRGIRPYRRVLLSIEGDPSSIPVDHLQPREDRRVEIILPGGDPVRLRVLDSGDRPVEGAEVLTYRSAEPLDQGSWSFEIEVSPPSTHRHTTDQDGLATLPPLGLGSWVIVARHRDYASGIESFGRFWNWTVFGDDVVIRLRPQAALTGQVTDLAGRPLDDVVVCCRSGRGNWGLRASLPLLPSARTDEDGNYRLDGVSAGRTTVMAIRPGGSPREVGIVHLPEVEHFDFSLPVAGVLRGRITDERTGAAIRGARVVAEVGTFSHDGLEYGAEALSDRTGRFEIRGMPVGGVDQLRVSRDGYRPFDIGLSAALHLVENAPTVYDVSLTPGATIEGVVTGPNGPVPGATVEFGATEGRWREWQSTPVGIDGRFRVTTLEDGDWKVTARAAGFRSEPKIVTAIAGGVVSVTLGLGPREKESREDFGEPTHGPEGTVILICGRVLTEAGTVPANARVQVNLVHDDSSSGEEPFRRVPAGVCLDADGSFQTDLSLWGTGKSVRIHAGAPGFAPTAPRLIEIEKGRTDYDADLLLTRGHTISGRVTDAATGEPVAGAAASLLIHKGTRFANLQIPSSGITVVHSVSDNDGRIEIRNVPGGAYGLAVRRVGFLDSLVSIRAPQDETTRIPLSSAHCLGGVIRYPDGSSPGPVCIWVRGESGGEFRSCSSAADGSFFVRGLPAGRYEVGIRRVISHAPLNFLPKVAGAFEAGQTDLVIEVKRGRRLTGSIRSENGDPVPHIFVKVIGPDRKEIGDSEMVGEDGRFEIVGLPEGECTVEIEERGFAAFRRDGIRAGSTDLEFTLSRGWSISGLLVDEAGKPLANCGLAAMDPGSRSRPDWEDAQGGTSEHGTFTITGLEEKTYEIRPMFARKVPFEPVGIEHGFVLLGKTTFAAGSSGVRLVATPGALISGNVVDEEGEPVDKAWVSLGGGRDWQDDSEWTGEDGEFRFDHLPPGEIRTITIHKPGLLEWELREVRSPRHLEVTLRAGLAISGRALSAAGEPLRNCELTLWPRGDGRWHDTHTDDEGRFRVTGLLPGIHTVSAHAAGDVDSLLLGEVKAGTEDVVLQAKQ